LSLLVNDAGSTLVVKGTALLLVLVTCKVLPALTLVIVVTISENELEVIRVLDAVSELVSVFVVSS